MVLKSKNMCLCLYLYYYPDIRQCFLVIVEIGLIAGLSLWLLNDILKKKLKESEDELELAKKRRMHRSNNFKVA